MTQREQQILQMIRSAPMISQQEIAQRLGITRSSVAVHISNLMRKGAIAGKGYVLPPESYTVVVGGVNVDIGGRAHRPLVAGDSNPGAVRVSLGGVGRNIAHNLCLMGQDVRLLTAYGEDLNGQRFRESSAEIGLNISHALQLREESTSTYLYIADDRGEMALALSDMAICDRITPEYLAEQLPLIQGAQTVVADANIPGASLIYLAENCRAPLFVDPVSTVKAQKLEPILHRIHTLKPNALEAALLSGIPVQTREDAGRAACVLLDKGVRRVFLTLGAGGVLAAEAGQQLWLPNLQGDMVNTTGCGDAFMAALVWAHQQGLSLEQTARAGLAAGAIAMESAQTINPALCASALCARAELQM